MNIKSLVVYCVYMYVELRGRLDIIEMVVIWKCFVEILDNIMKNILEDFVLILMLSFYFLIIVIMLVKFE